MAGYQTRPLTFNISLAESNTDQFAVHIEYRLAGPKDGPTRILPFDISLRERHLSEAQRFTYLHPSSGVSYAILRPPPALCNILHGPDALPVILALHGAGLNVDSVEARAMLDGAYGVCAWMLFPSGVTSWSGDDWRTSQPLMTESATEVKTQIIGATLMRRLHSLPSRSGWPMLDGRARVLACMI